jgi:cytochrome c
MRLPRPSHLLFALAGLAAAWPALASPQLAQSKNCAACHQMEAKAIGPSYKQIAQKYTANPDTVAMLATKIVKGGQGVWGPVPMPANGQVSEAEARTLASWILSLR